MKRLGAIILIAILTAGCNSSTPPSPSLPGFIDGALAIADPSVVNVSSGDLELRLGRIDSLKASGVRYDINWRYMQPDSPDQWRGNTDDIGRAAKEHDKPVLGVIGYAPKWAAKPGCPGGTAACAPKDASTYATFVEQVVRKYSGPEFGIHHYELWNEPNLTARWLPGPPSATEYAQIVNEVCPRIKKIDPKAFVVTGGLALIGGDKGIPMPQFTQELLAAGLSKDCYDAFGVHLYGDFAVRELDAVRAILDQNGHEGKKIWVTEVGMDTREPCGGSENPSEVRQREMLINIVGVLRARSWSGPIFWFTTSDVVVTPTNTNRHGLLCADGRDKPAAVAYRQLVSA